MLANRRFSLVAAHDITGLLAGHSVGKKGGGISQSTVGMVTFARITQPIAVDRGDAVCTRYAMHPDGITKTAGSSMSRGHQPLQLIPHGQQALYDIKHGANTAGDMHAGPAK